MTNEFYKYVVFDASDKIDFKSKVPKRLFDFTRIRIEQGIIWMPRFFKKEFVNALLDLTSTFNVYLEWLNRNCKKGGGEK